MKTFFPKTTTLVLNTISAYQSNHVPRLGAALAYYTIFSLPALIIIIVGIINMVFRGTNFEERLYGEIGDLLGTDTANQIETAVAYLGSPAESTWATLLGILIAIYVATSIFFIIQEALNTIYNVQTAPPKMGIIWMLINRIISLGMVLIFSVLLIAAILINTVVGQLSSYVGKNEAFLKEILPDVSHDWLPFMTSSFLFTLRTGVTIFLLTCFFFLIYYVLPAVKVRFKYTLIGAVAVAFFFWIGQELLNYYLNTVAAISAYGAAGSLIILLLWVYYSAQLIFLGGAFIKSYAEFKGDELKPKKFARMIHNHSNKK